jgi:hypothetical protein
MKVAFIVKAVFIMKVVFNWKMGNKNAAEQLPWNY